MTLGERIKFIRKKHKISQIEFANVLGVSQTHISKIETGKDNPSSKLLYCISDLFNVNVEWIKSGTGEMCTDDFELTMAEITLSFNKLLEHSDEFEEITLLTALEQMSEIFQIIKKLPNNISPHAYLSFSNYIESIYKLMVYLNVLTSEILSSKNIGKKVDEIFEVTDLYSAKANEALESMKDLFLGAGEERNNS